MKKNLLNPGFEFVFSLGIVATLMLPSILMAQEPKDIKVIIQNNDTTINGKNIKELSAAERKKALKQIDDMGIVRTTKGKGRNSVYLFHKNDNNGQDMIVEREMDGKDNPMTFNFKIDSAGNRYEIHPEDRMKDAGKLARDFRFELKGDRERPRWSIGENRRNTQNFSYSSTNNDGISTNINYRVGDVNREKMQSISGTEKADLAINDLMLTPSFSTGKTNLSFTLAEKGSAEIQFKDSDGKTLWTDKTSGTFSKSFELPQNGIYYLQIKQGNKLGLRRIVKEQ